MTNKGILDILQNSKVPSVTQIKKSLDNGSSFNNDCIIEAIKINVSENIFKVIFDEYTNNFIDEVIMAFNVYMERQKNVSLMKIFIFNLINIIKIFFSYQNINDTVKNTFYYRIIKHFDNYDFQIINQKDITNIKYETIISVIKKTKKGYIKRFNYGDDSLIILFNTIIYSELYDKLSKNQLYILFSDVKIPIIMIKKFSEYQNKLLSKEKLCEVIYELSKFDKDEIIDIFLRGINTQSFIDKKTSIDVDRWNFINNNKIKKLNNFESYLKYYQDYDKIPKLLQYKLYLNGSFQEIISLKKKLHNKINKKKIKLMIKNNNLKVFQIIKLLKDFNSKKKLNPSLISQLYKKCYNKKDLKSLDEYDIFEYINHIKLNLYKYIDKIGNINQWKGKYFCKPYIYLISQEINKNNKIDKYYSNIENEILLYDKNEKIDKHLLDGFIDMIYNNCFQKLFKKKFLIKILEYYDYTYLFQHQDINSLIDEELSVHLSKYNNLYVYDFYRDKDNIPEKIIINSINNNDIKFIIWSIKYKKFIVTKNIIKKTVNNKDFICDTEIVKRLLIYY